MSRRSWVVGAALGVAIGLIPGVGAASPAIEAPPSPSADADFELSPTTLSVDLWAELGGETPIRGAPRAGDKVELVTLTCQRGERGSRCRVAPLPAGSPLEPWSARFAACYRVTAGATSAASIRKVERALGSTQQVPSDDALRGLVGARRFAAAVIGSEMTVDESVESGCEHRVPGLGCDPVTAPTGRKLKVIDVHVLAAGPHGYRFGPNLGSSTGQVPFAPIHPDRTWIVIRGSNLRKVPELLLGSTGELRTRLVGFLGRAAPWLDASPAPRLRAALLIDLAYAALLTGDPKRGRAWLAELDALIASRGFDGSGLELDALRAPLRKLATGAWSPTDPCVSVPAPASIPTP